MLELLSRSNVEHVERRLREGCGERVPVPARPRIDPELVHERRPRASRVQDREEGLAIGDDEVAACAGKAARRAGDARDQSFALDVEREDALWARGSRESWRDDDRKRTPLERLA